MIKKHPLYRDKKLHLHKQVSSLKAAAVLLFPYSIFFAFKDPTVNLYDWVPTEGLILTVSSSKKDSFFAEITDFFLVLRSLIQKVT